MAGAFGTACGQQAAWWRPGAQVCTGKAASIPSIIPIARPIAGSRFIDRPYLVVTHCVTVYRGECQKRSSRPQLVARSMLWSRLTGTRKNVFIVMVTTYGVANNAYAKELVAGGVAAEALLKE